MGASARKRNRYDRQLARIRFPVVVEGTEYPDPRSVKSKAQLDEIREDLAEDLASVMNTVTLLFSIVFGAAFGLVTSAGLTMLLARDRAGARVMMIAFVMAIICILIGALVIRGDARSWRRLNALRRAYRERAAQLEVRARAARHRAFSQSRTARPRHRYR